MIPLNSRQLIVIGFVCVLIGVILPFLMVLQIITASFLLSFFSFGVSAFGVLLGMIGAGMYGLENLE
jgi:hypothetical protein